MAAGTSATRGLGTITGGTIPAHEKSGQVWAQYAISAGPRIVAATGNSAEEASGRVSAENDGSQAPLWKSLDDLPDFERPVAPLERKPRSRLEKEKAVAADPRKERQGGAIGRDLERVPGGLELLVAFTQELPDLGPLLDESACERHERRLVGGVGRVDDGHGSAEEPRERRRERLEEGLSPVRGRERSGRLGVLRPRKAVRGFRDEGVHVDFNRKRPDRRPVSRDARGVGAEVHRAVRPRQDEPRDLHEIVILGRAPEGGARGRARRYEVGREPFRRERLHQGEERASEETRLLAGEDGRLLAAHERGESRVRVRGGAARSERRHDRARPLGNGPQVGPVRKEGRDVGRSRREAAREGGNPGNVRERNRRHRSLSTRVFALALRARRISRGDFRRSKGEPSKFP